MRVEEGINKGGLLRVSVHTGTFVRQNEKKAQESKASGCSEKG